MTDQTLADIGEFGLIRYVRDLLDKEGIHAQEVTLGTGDDCASFMPREKRELLVTCDSVVEGRHYLPEFTTPMDLGRRAMVMNISDIGAMGGIPLYALVSLGLKEDTLVTDVHGMYMGFIEELKPFNASVIGGNITKSEHSNFIDITLIGEVESGTITRRSTARAGDSILVTGYPGQAAAGLRFLLNDRNKKKTKDHPLVHAYNRPSHRAREGRVIAKSGYATAMIDISDGFMGDLWHICQESGVGAEIVKKKLPVSSYMREIAVPPGHDIYDMIMSDSDDYELIVTCLSEDVPKIQSLVAELSDIPVTEVGRITDESEVMMLVSKDGAKREITPRGWDHFQKRDL